MVKNSLINRYLKQSASLFRCELFIGGDRSLRCLDSKSKLELLLISESPYDNDSYNQPYKGRAGKLLNNILCAINRNKNKEVPILTIFKTNPLNNRNPLKSEIMEFENLLLKYIQSEKPKLILALGKIVGKGLIKEDISLNQMRASTYHYHDIPLRITHDPRSLLANPELKKTAWTDFQWVESFLNK